MNQALERVDYWICGRFRFDVRPNARPVILGIINVTPDSFSDGGRFASSDAAVEQAERMVYDGASILDVGGESTRPGSLPVSIDEELNRVLPVVSTLAERGHCVSVDTRHVEVMAAAIKAGACLVNDVYALRAAGAVELCASAGVGVVLMHMQGEPGTMQHAPHYDDVVTEVGAFLRDRASVCERAGIARERIALDPGFGFGKTAAHNLALTRGVADLARFGFPIVAGWSRKRTIGDITKQTVASERVSGSVAATLACVSRGARVVRVHDVRATADALAVWHAIELS